MAQRDPYVVEALEQPPARVVVELDRLHEVAGANLFAYKVYRHLGRRIVFRDGPEPFRRGLLDDGREQPGLP
jgi:hypothetical protein